LPATTCRANTAGSAWGWSPSHRGAELSRDIALPPRGVDILGPNVSPILYHLDEAQKKKYLLPTIGGEYKWCLAQTEPDAGGDPGSMVRPRAAGRPLRHQRGEALHHRRRRRAFHPADRRDRPIQGIAWRDLGLHRRHEGAGRKTAARAGADGRRPTVGIAFEDVRVPVEDRIGRGGRRFSARAAPGSMSAASATERAAWA